MYIVRLCYMHPRIFFLLQGFAEARQSSYQGSKELPPLRLPLEVSRSPANPPLRCPSPPQRRQGRAGREWGGGGRLTSQAVLFQN